MQPVRRTGWRGAGLFEPVAVFVKKICVAQGIALGGLSPPLLFIRCFFVVFLDFADLGEPVVFAVDGTHVVHEGIEVDVA